jgi:hypothetical protein
MGFNPDHPTSRSTPTGIDACEWLTDDATLGPIFERVKPHLPQEFDGCAVAGINARWRLFRYAQVILCHILYRGIRSARTARAPVYPVSNSRLIMDRTAPTALTLTGRGRGVASVATLPQATQVMVLIVRSHTSTTHSGIADQG